MALPEIRTVSSGIVGGLRLILGCSSSDNSEIGVAACLAGRAGPQRAEVYHGRPVFREKPIERCQSRRR
jgi:hypothetical protein